MNGILSLCLPLSPPDFPPTIQAFTEPEKKEHRERPSDEAHARCIRCARIHYVFSLSDADSPTSVSAGEDLTFKIEKRMDSAPAVDREHTSRSVHAIAMALYLTEQEGTETRQATILGDGFVKLQKVRTFFSSGIILQRLTTSIDCAKIA